MAPAAEAESALVAGESASSDALHDHDRGYGHGHDRAVSQAREFRTFL